MSTAQSVSIAQVELRPGLRRVVVPLTDSPLGSVNVYLIDGDDGPIVIDTGWQTPEALAAVEEGLAWLGATVADLAQIVLTHGHPDHAGLAATLRERSGAPIALHPADAPYVDPAYRQDREAAGGMLGWLARNGLPLGDEGAMFGSRRGMADRNPPFVADRAVAEGDWLPLGPFTFRVYHVPGHAPGQVCLHDEAAGLLIAGDHVLPTISPNVGIFRPDDGDPLGDYLASLARVRDLTAGCILPGHGAPFTGLAARVDELAAHHEKRLDEIAALLTPTPATAHAIAADLTWGRGTRRFADLPFFQQTMALAETIAHLEVLRDRQRASREEGEGVIGWRA